MRTIYDVMLENPADGTQLYWHDNLQVVVVTDDFDMSKTPYKYAFVQFMGSGDLLDFKPSTRYRNDEELLQDFAHQLEKLTGDFVYITFEKKD